MNYTKTYKEKYGLKFIPIVESGLSNDTPNAYIELAKQHDSLLKDNENNTFEAKVWPNNATFLDWFNDYSKEVWSLGLI
jgi:alpha-glucosidase (family GH31 glycosyl hydrolase)